MEPNSPQSDFDVLIAGGGIAGVLAAARLALAQPSIRIALIEKDATLGGRLRGTDRASETHGCGLNAASDALYEFWRQTFLADSPGGDSSDSNSPDDEPAVAAGDRRHQRVGVLAGQKIAEVPIDQWFTAKGARMLGGLVAAREWPEVEEIFRAGATAAGPQLPASAGKKRQGASASADDSPSGASRGEGHGDHAGDDPSDHADEHDADETQLDHPVAHYWKRTRKAASAEVLEHFANAFGIPDVWNASAEAVAERARYYAGRLHSGIWDEAIRRLTERAWFQERVTVLTSTRIADAERDGDLWRLATTVGPIHGRALIVAQPPWQAAVWLKRSLWPAQLLHIASKTKPVSTVVLSEHIEAPTLDIPDVVIVPAERAQIVRNGPREICFQATIDFELSMQAPAVVKAVRSLKRARKKLLALFPNAVSENNHIALIPVAWAQPPAQAERRWLLRSVKRSPNTAELAFCGDAYGDSYDGDANTLRSVMGACAAVSATPAT